MTIALAGAFAATDTDPATLQIQTTVSQLAGFKVTQAAATESTTFALFTGMATADLLGVDRSGAFTEGSTAYITAANNASVAYTIGVMAAAMAGTDTPANKINYEVLIGSVSKWNTTSTADTPVNVLTVTGNAAGMVVSSLPISIALNTSEYDDAAPDTYVGLITFSVTSN